MATKRKSVARFVRRNHGYDVFWKDEKRPRGFTYMDSQGAWGWYLTGKQAGGSSRSTRALAANAIFLAAGVTDDGGERP